MVKNLIAQKWNDLSTEVQITDYDQVKVARKNIKDLRDSFKNVDIFFKAKNQKGIFNPSSGSNTSVKDVVQ